jgi:hypothetical protein
MGAIIVQGLIIGAVFAVVYLVMQVVKSRRKSE